MTSVNPAGLPGRRVPLVADLDHAGARLERAVHLRDAEEDVQHVPHGRRARPRG